MDDYKVKKADPKGIDEAQYKRCKEKVKVQSSKINEYAVSAYSLKKSKEKNHPYPKSVEEFVKDFKKSYDFRDTKVSIDSKDQQAAEQTADSNLVSYIKASLDSELNKIPFEKGMLTMFVKERGLYSGFFSDEHGQIVDKFDDQTVEMVAKNMEIKELYLIPETTKDISDDSATLDQADTIAEAHMDHHNKTMHSPGSEKGNYVKIKYGDFELEIKKSIHNFVSNFKTNKSNIEDKNDIKKAIKAWRRNSRSSHVSDLEAARSLIKDWEAHEESFNQILHALRQDDE